jgi:hypothetical protein
MFPTKIKGGVASRMAPALPIPCEARSR